MLGIHTIAAEWLSNLKHKQFQVFYVRIYDTNLHYLKNDPTGVISATKRLHVTIG